jgi:oxalate decarboxylase/phosphoglucose isomerase-like protein (cupin superfamily)
VTASIASFGTAIMEPGNIAGEYYMTRGHFHARRDMGEVYYTQSGQGILLLDYRDGQQSVTVEMKPGVCAFIPPDWAHRSINTGSDQLIFVWYATRRPGTTTRTSSQRVCASASCKAQTAGSKSSTTPPRSDPSNLLGWLLPIGERHPAANAVIPEPPNTHGI